MQNSPLKGRPAGLDLYAMTSRHYSGMRIYRHGDVLIAPVDCVPADARPHPGLILAQGEITGHAHRVETDARAELYEVGQDLFLRVLGAPARVVHEEHRTIELPLGNYRVWRQREYDPAQDLTVMD
jgi:hypothetical protein